MGVDIPLGKIRGVVRIPIVYRWVENYVDEQGVAAALATLTHSVNGTHQQPAFIQRGELSARLAMSSMLTFRRKTGMLCSTCHAGDTFGSEQANTQKN